ncbi:MAG TPA: glycosyltransferase family 39 protein [Candidatus Aquilonibacter sp.]|nr:glycosyltransferase family 39 protein [Candidatus Aquilonibacter sp.]
MLELVQKHPRFFLWATLVALALRLLFVFRFPAIVDDSRLYADIANNWLHHEVYGITNSGRIMPTLSRLPGYPAFLAAIFAVFGTNNFRAVLLIQVLLDLMTCLLVADTARRLFSDRAARAAFLLAGLCPFLANYAGAALTETLEIFFTALALDAAICGLQALHQRTGAPMRPWFTCGLAIGASILLRPDGGILLAVLGGYLFFLAVKFAVRARPTTGGLQPRTIFRAGVILSLSALVLLVPWTWRNLYTLHRFEPLAPRYANDSDEALMPGFNRWVKTWLAEYVSVEEVYWNVPGDTIDASRLPDRAFDSPSQRQQTEQLIADYNQDREITPQLDARFAALAAERIQSAPLRYYVWLPALRIADMWMRPRTELLGSDPRWWEFNDDPRWLAVSIGFGVVNLVYVALATVGLWRTRAVFGICLFVVFVLLRSMFLGTLENPEPRYTLECYPVVILLAAALFMRNFDPPYRKSV